MWMEVTCLILRQTPRPSHFPVQELRRRVWTCEPSSPLCHDLIYYRMGQQILPKHGYHLLTARHHTPKDKIYKSLSVRHGIFCFYRILRFINVLTKACRSDPHSSTRKCTLCFYNISVQCHPLRLYTHIFR